LLCGLLFIFSSLLFCCQNEMNWFGKQFTPSLKENFLCEPTDQLAAIAYGTSSSSQHHIFILRKNKHTEWVCCAFHCDIVRDLSKEWASIAEGILSTLITSQPFCSIVI
jgi:hypothetical protein